MPLVFRIEETSSKIPWRQTQIAATQIVTAMSEQEETEATEKENRSVISVTSVPSCSIGAVVGCGYAALG
jgi:hypothetical protein